MFEEAQEITELSRAVRKTTSVLREPDQTGLSLKKKKKKTVNLGDEKRALFTLGPRAQLLTAGEAGTPRGQATRGRCHRAGRSGPGAHSTATL